MDSTWLNHMDGYIHNKLPLVAVVTPVLNGCPYLQETISSVQTQTYPNIIHIIVDNASSDGTADVIQAARGGPKPILSIRNAETVAQVENWEIAVRLVPQEAEYFRILCADDLMPPDSIETMVHLAETDAEIGLVGCLQGMGSIPMVNESIDAVGLPSDRCVFDGKWTAKAYLIGSHGGLSPNHTLVRRRYLNEDYPFFNPGVVSFDTDECLRILLRCRYGFIHQVKGWTRVHENRVTAKMTDYNQIYILDWLHWIDTFGRELMSDLEFRACRRLHLYHHYRRMLVWQF